MTPKISLFLGLTLLFTSCDPDADMISPLDRFIPTASTELDPSSSEGDLSRGDTCMELVTTHWLIGQWMYQPIKMGSAFDADQSAQDAAQYVIEARGDAMSEVYTRGLSDLTIRYNSDSQRLTGTLITRFYYGEVLELAFDDDAQVRYENEAMILQVPVQEATFTTESQVMELSVGTISFSFPLKPEGDFKTEIHTTTRLCGL